MTKSVLFPLLIWGLLPATSAASDLSSYRDFQLGSNLATVSKIAGLSPSLAKTVYSRPSLIQELGRLPVPPNG